MRENLYAKYKRQSKSSKLVMGILLFFVDIILIGKYCIGPDGAGVRTFAIVMTLLVNLLYVSILIYNPFKRALKKYCVTPERLDYDYQHAVEILKDTCYIGEKYFIHIKAASIVVIKNTDIVWIYKDYYYHTNGTRFSKYEKRDELVIYTIDKKKYEFTAYGGYTTDDILRIKKHYTEHFPHVLIGDGLERRRIFKEEYNRFLNIQYYPGLQKEKEGLV